MVRSSFIRSRGDSSGAGRLSSFRNSQKSKKKTKKSEILQIDVQQCAAKWTPLISGLHFGLRSAFKPLSFKLVDYFRHFVKALLGQISAWPPSTLSDRLKGRDTGRSQVKFDFRTRNCNSVEGSHP